MWNFWFITVVCLLTTRCMLAMPRGCSSTDACFLLLRGKTMKGRTEQERFAHTTVPLNLHVNIVSLFRGEFHYWFLVFFLLLPFSFTPFSLSFGFIREGKHSKCFRRILSDRWSKIFLHRTALRWAAILFILLHSTLCWNTAFGVYSLINM